MNSWDTSLYYTFSTISQTLAGAIGLLSAFVLYKFQILNAQIQFVTDQILSERGHPKEDDAHGKCRHWFLYYCMRSEVPEGAPKKDWFEKEAGRIQALLNYKRNLRYWLWVALALTALIILYSIIMLKFVPNIIAMEIMHLLHWIGIGGAAVAIVSYLMVIFFALKNPDQKLDGRYWI